jgi:hypothetical protein
LTDLEKIGFDEIILVDGDGNPILLNDKKVEMTNE